MKNKRHASVFVFVFFYIDFRQHDILILLEFGFGKNMLFSSIDECDGIGFFYGLNFV